MNTVIDHPGWDESWAAPSKHTIDDLTELGYLRQEWVVDPSRNNQRAFSLTMRGREAAAALDPSATSPPGVSSPTTSALAPPAAMGADRRAAADSSSASITAFVTWAHAHPSWEQTVFAFVQGLRKLGVDADVDLFARHDPGVNWTTFGPSAIARSDYVLLAVSDDFKRRWEGTNDPTEGAGAAREANVLKSMFNDDQARFQRMVKIVVLPGASEDDIPAELKASVLRFEIASFDQDGLEHLLRTLTGHPAYLRSQVGPLPALPPRGATASGDHAAAGPAQRVQAAIRALDAQRQRGNELLGAISNDPRLTGDRLTEWRLSNSRALGDLRSLEPVLVWIDETLAVLDTHTVGERGRFLQDELLVDDDSPASTLRSRLNQLGAIINALRAPGSERMLP